MTTRRFETQSVYDDIRSGTYPEMGDPAVNLYERILYEASHAGEAVNFVGALALDVGGYDGCYRSVIRSLGANQVMTIEPNAEALGKGVERGIIPAGGAFGGTVEQWVAAGNLPADSVYAFNMMPSLPGNIDFLRALVASVKVGGILVTSFREPTTSYQFSGALRRNPEFGVRMLYDGLPRETQPQLDGIRNKFIYLWRREQ